MSASAFTFDCEGAPVVAILHQPAQPPTRGVVMVVAGGPQYRVGGHRQLTLWSRRLCDAGHAVLRFDYRGTGDSDGEFRNFVAIDTDIRSAIDQLLVRCPSVREVILWGECNAASAILYYAHSDSRVNGAVLLNPWVHTQAGAAKATLQRYYLQRLMQPSFWRKVLGGKFNPFASAGSAVRLVMTALRGSSTSANLKSPTDKVMAPVISRGLPLPEGLLQGVQRFKGRLLVVLSGRDSVAHEYEALIKASPAWQQALAARQTRQHVLPEGDHTFSSAVQRDQVVAWALTWLKELPAR
jgi:exosortase A-associated hydrolase 1